MTDQPGPPAVTTSPLVAADPTKIGDFWLDARLVATNSGVAYLAHESGGPPVMIVLLSQGATDDAAARDRLAGQVDRMHIDTVVARGGLDQNRGRLAAKFRPEDDDPPAVDAAPQAPWVALAFDGSPAAVAEARRLLAEVDLAWLPQQGQVSGPDYRLHWIDRHAPGLAHVWPLPWPGRRDRGGPTTIVASFVLMLAIAAVAILIAILIFSQSPPVPPLPPPPPTTGTAGPDTSPPPTSPDQDTASPSPDTASPSPTDSPSDESPSPSDPDTASPTPTGTEPAGGRPSPQLPI